MKRINIILIVLVTQFSFSQSIKFGIKAGINYANVIGSEIKTNAITNFHGGFVSEFKVTKGFAIQPELLYITEGATYKTALEDIKNELGYLTIPIMLKINVSDNVTLELGPQAGFLVVERKKVDPYQSKTFDFAINAGLGLKITDNLFAQARYGLGLTEAKVDSKIKNSVFQLSLGFFF
jgi:Outer membrane protein beta-barrel domain